MAKLNFNEVRGFNDSITFTFQFVKQEFKSLLKAFGVIVLPFLLADLWMKSYLVRSFLPSSLSPVDDDSVAWENVGSVVWNYAIGVVGFVWLSLMVLFYIRVYREKRLSPEEEGRISVKEIWAVMWPRIGVAYVWAILYFLTIIIGMLFLIVPGIYFGVAFLFSVYFILLRDRPLFSGLSDAMELVKGQWWNFFGYLIVLQLIVGALSYIFSIPYMVLVFKSAFFSEEPGVYEMTFCMMLTTLGQYLLQIVLLVGVATRFYSLLEQKEHTFLFRKIESIGSEQSREEVF